MAFTKKKHVRKEVCMLIKPTGKGSREIEDFLTITISSGFNKVVQMMAAGYNLYDGCGL